MYLDPQEVVPALDEVPAKVTGRLADHLHRDVVPGSEAKGLWSARGGGGDDAQQHPTYQGMRGTFSRS